jgi:hypothetical protein
MANKDRLLEIKLILIIDTECAFYKNNVTRKLSMEISKEKKLITFSIKMSSS